MFAKIERKVTLIELTFGIVMIATNLILRNAILGIFGLVLYFISTSYLLQNPVKKLLRIHESVTAYLLSSLIVLFLLSVLVAVPIVIFEVSNPVLLLVVVAVAVVCLGANRIKPTGYEGGYEEVAKSSLISNGRIIQAEFVLFVIFAVLSFLLLCCASTGDVVLSLWDRIPKGYVYIYVVEAFLMLLILLSKIDYRIKLSFLLTFSLMQHSYMPIIYQMGYGGDMWDELACSMQIFNEGSIGWTLFKGVGLGPNYLPLGSLFLPAAFFTKTHISSVGLIYLLHSITNIDMLKIHKWLSPIMWSIFVPIILYQIGLKLFKNREESLFLAFLPSVFYFMIVFGSHSLAHSTAMVFFMFYLLCYLSTDRMNRTTTIALFLFSFSFVFVHLVFFILSMIFLAVVAVTETSLRLKPDSKRSILVLISFLAALTSLLIPYLDIIFTRTASFSCITPSCLVDAVGRWLMDASGVTAFASPFYAYKDPVPLHAIKNTHTLRFAFGSGALRGTIVLLLWTFVIIGVVHLYRKRLRTFLPLFSLFIITQLSTFIGWYLMTGTPNAVNRLDLPRELFVLFFVGAGLQAVIEKMRNLSFSVSLRDLNKEITISIKSASVRTYGMILLIAFLTVASASAYTLNPRAQNITTDEFNACHYVVNQIQLSNKRVIVLGDECIYRVINYISKNQVLYGNVILERGRPAEENERRLNSAYNLFRSIIKKPNVSDVLAFASHTNSEVVYIVLPPRVVPVVDVSVLSTVFGAPLRFNNAFVFRIEKIEEGAQYLSVNSGISSRLQLIYPYALLVGVENASVNINFCLANELKKTNAISIKALNTDPLKGWEIIQGHGTLSEDKDDKIEGNESIYAMNGRADKEGNLIYTFTSSHSLNFQGMDFVELWTKFNITGHLYVSLRTYGRGYIRWWGVEDSLYTINSNRWQRWILPINSPTGEVGIFNVTEVNKIFVGIRGIDPNQPVVFKVNDVNVDVGQWISVEVGFDVFSFKNSNFKLYSWDGEKYEAIVCWDDWHIHDELGDGYLLSGISLNKVYQGCKELWITVYPVGFYGETKKPLFGTADMITYKLITGTQTGSVGFAIKLPPSTGSYDLTEAGATNKVKLRFEIGD